MKTEEMREAATGSVAERSLKSEMTSTKSIDPPFAEKTCNVTSYTFAESPLKATYGSKAKVFGLLNPDVLNRYTRQALRSLGMKRFQASFTRIR